MDEVQKIVGYVNNVLEHLLDVGKKNRDIIYQHTIQRELDEFNRKFSPYSMSFMKALEQMKEGKRVRRRGWDENHYIFLNSQGVVTSHDEENLLMFHSEYFTATDWEVVK